MGRATCLLSVAPLLLAAAACTSTRMSTAEIYAEWIGPRVTCTPNAVARQEQRQDEVIRRRFEDLEPWLEADIGADRFAAIQHDYDDLMRTVEWGSVSCPTEERRMHLRTRRLMLLHELENRRRHSLVH